MITGEIDRHQEAVETGLRGAAFAGQSVSGWTTMHAYWQRFASRAARRNDPRLGNQAIGS